LLTEHEINIPIVRSSYVPEYGRTGGAPGTTNAVLVAEHLVGALGDGLAAAGLWEIQNRTGGDDYRYWFDGDQLAPAASLWPLLTQTIGLGQGTNRSVAVTCDDSLQCYAAHNSAGRRVAVLVLHEPTDLAKDAFLCAKLRLSRGFATINSPFRKRCGLSTLV